MTGRELSAADLDHPSLLPPEIQDERLAPPPDGVGPQVWTADGWQPYIADEPTPLPQSAPDNPLNPKGSPSLSRPQQTTPLTSHQGVLTGEELADKETLDALMVEDGLTPDNPFNPKGTPDFIVEPAAAPQTDDANPPG